MMKAIGVSAFFVNSKRGGTFRLLGRKHTRFDGWRVTLKATDPYTDAIGKRVHGLGHLRCPRGDAHQVPLREPVTPESAPALAAAVAHILDVPA